MSYNTTYNGWKNYATWNVALWLDNDESMYRYYTEAVKRQRAHPMRNRITAQFAKRLVQDLMPEGTPDMNPIPNRAYRAVDFVAIAVMMAEE